MIMPKAVLLENTGVRLERRADVPAFFFKYHLPFILVIELNVRIGIFSISDYDARSSEFNGRTSTGITQNPIARTWRVGVQRGRVNKKKYPYTARPCRDVLHDLP